MLETPLLPPMRLAAEPVRLDLAGTAYSHETQQNVWASEEIQTAASRTYGATQTFDTKGKPTDRDND